MKYGNFAVTFGLTEEMKNIVLNVVKNKNMNKLLITITISILLSGCRRDPINFSDGAIITDIKKYGNLCVYYSKNTVWFELFSNPKGIFCDSCGKFTVGDTIKTVKK